MKRFGCCCLVKRVGTVRPSLFLLKFSLRFLAHCDFCGNLSQQLNITYFYIFVQTLRG